MPGEENRVDLAIGHTTDVRPGDYFYLCSDGMLEIMEDDELIQILSAEITDEEKIEVLRQKTVNNKDNHTAYLIKVAGVELEAGDQSLLNDESTTRTNAMNIVPRYDDDISLITGPEANHAGIPPVPQAGNPVQNVSAVAPIPTAAPTRPPQPMPQPAQKGSTRLWIPLLAGILLVLVAGIAYHLLRGNNRNETEVSVPTQTTPSSVTTDVDAQEEPSATPSNPEQEMTAPGHSLNIPERPSTQRENITSTPSPSRATAPSRPTTSTPVRPNNTQATPAQQSPANNASSGQSTANTEHTGNLNLPQGSGGGRESRESARPSTAPTTPPPSTPQTTSDSKQ